uniref:Uncharacterized protein n=1 Tax=Gadus morhua TaxID=8049 RepID=A0A8C5BEF0_GADMO
MWNQTPLCIIRITLDGRTNLTTNSITLINTQLSSTRLMVLQNRAALDYLLAAVGGTCKVVGPECCTDITDGGTVVEISIITINIQSHTNYINLVYIIIIFEGTVYILPVT